MVEAVNLSPNITMPLPPIEIKELLPTKKLSIEYGGINLVPVANSFMFLRQDRPEIVCEIGEPKTYTVPDIDRKDFTHKIQKEFENFLDNHDLQISKGNFEGYHYEFKQKLHWWRAIEQKLKSIGIKEENE